jgi:hypothetical protein
MKRGFDMDSVSDYPVYANVHPANGSHLISVLFLALSTFSKEQELVAAFEEISLSFKTEKSANKFTQDLQAPGFGCRNSFAKSTTVIVHPDFSGSSNAANAVYHAVNNYRDSLIAINKIGLVILSEAANELLNNVEGYIKAHFGSDSIRIE